MAHSKWQLIVCNRMVSTWLVYQEVCESAYFWHRSHAVYVIRAELLAYTKLSRPVFKTIKGFSCNNNDAREPTEDYNIILSEIKFSCPRQYNFSLRTLQLNTELPKARPTADVCAFDCLRKKEFSKMWSPELRTGGDLRAVRGTIKKTWDGDWVILYPKFRMI